MGCRGDEASDHCKITVLVVINGLEKKKEKKESKGPVATMQFSGLLLEARYLARPGLPHREHSISLEKYIFPPKKIEQWKHADSLWEFNSSAE